MISSYCLQYSQIQYQNIIFSLELLVDIIVTLVGMYLISTSNKKMAQYGICFLGFCVSILHIVTVSLTSKFLYSSGDNYYAAHSPDLITFAFCSTIIPFFYIIQLYYYLKLKRNTQTFAYLMFGEMWVLALSAVALAVSASNITTYNIIMNQTNTNLSQFPTSFIHLFHCWVAECVILPIVMPIIIFLNFSGNILQFSQLLSKGLTSTISNIGRRDTRMSNISASGQQNNKQNPEIVVQKQMTRQSMQRRMLQ